MNTYFWGARFDLFHYKLLKITLSFNYVYVSL